jgi:hypothetical protein
LKEVQGNLRLAAWNGEIISRGLAICGEYAQDENDGEGSNQAAYPMASDIAREASEKSRNYGLLETAKRGAKRG